MWLWYGGDRSDGDYEQIHDTITDIQGGVNIQIKDSDSNTGSPAYPLDFADDNKMKSNSNSDNKRDKRNINNATHNAHTRTQSHGPMSNFNNIHSVASQSSTTTTPSRNRNNYNYNKMPMIGDDINVNHIYTSTREPNLSMSIGPNLLFPGPNNNNPFPRISSTSSDFTHLIDQDTQRNTSQHRNDNIFSDKSVPPIYDNKNNNNNTKMKMKVKVMQHLKLQRQYYDFSMCFDGTYAYGGSRYSGYITEGEDIDEDEDINEDDAYGGSGYDGYYRN